MAIEQADLDSFPFLAVNTGPGPEIPNVPGPVPGLLGHTRPSTESTESTASAVLGGEDPSGYK